MGAEGTEGSEFGIETGRFRWAISSYLARPRATAAFFDRHSN